MMERKDDENFLHNARDSRDALYSLSRTTHDFELDLHRPYIDDVPMGDTLNGEWKRVPDVFDCWFESGSMPFASNGYPFEKKDFNPKRFFGLAPKGYPADFIAEVHRPDARVVLLAHRAWSGALRQESRTRRS